MTIEYLVYSDNKYADPIEIATQTPGLPNINVQYTQYNGATCVSKQASRRDEHANYWDVTCEFETNEPDQEQGGGQNNGAGQDNANPTTWYPILKVDSFITKDTVMYEDRTPGTAVRGTDYPTDQFKFGDVGGTTIDPPFPICNSAMQLFESPVLEKRSLAQISFAQFEEVRGSRSSDLRTIMTRNEAVNAGTFEGFQKRTLLCNVTSAERGFFNGYECWRVGYRLTWDPETWDLFVADYGTRYWDSGTSLWKAYYEGDNATQTHGKLNLKGQKEATTIAPSYLQFRVKREISFSFIRTQ
jgi:hypothetical protein